MTEPIVLRKGWSERELQTILHDFSSQYELGSSLKEQVTPRPDGSFKVSFPAGIAPDMFAFLVNYVRYPRDFELRGRQILVVGRVTLAGPFAPPVPDVAGRNAVFYVPTNDTEYDLIFVKTDDGRAFEVSFTDMRWKPVRDPRLPEGADRLL